ncbi:MAG: TolC family protein [Bacteroidia bacterium]
MRRVGAILCILLFNDFCINTTAQNKPWSLKACIDTAIQRNITVKQGQLNNQISEINLEQAKENLYPNLNVTDAPGFNFGKGQNASGVYVEQNITSNSFAITSNVTLYNGLLYQNTIKQNKFVYDAGIQGVEKMKNDLTLNVLADYLQVIASYEQVDIAVSQIASDTAQLVETRKWVDAGKYPILNLLQMQSQLAADKYTKVNAETALEIAKVNLMQAMDIPVISDFEVERPVVNDSTLSVTPLTSGDIYNTAQGIMPEIKNALLSFEASEVAVKVAQSLYLPKLTLGGSIKTSGISLAYQEMYVQGPIGYLQSNPSDRVIGLNELASMNNNFSNLWSQTNYDFNQAIGFTLTIPVFNNFQAKNTTAIARINSEIARLTEESVALTLRQNIEQAYTQLLAAAAQYVSAKEALETEALTYANIEKKFEIGLSSATDFLVEKSNYLKAQQNLIQAKYNYLFKIKLIGFYLGKPITM